ncbi:MAG: hypothetical protein ACOVQA_10205 [Thermoflexibacteraceae bacterium]
MEFYYTLSVIYSLPYKEYFLSNTWLKQRLGIGFWAWGLVVFGLKLQK